jgi:tRNA A-37 threonylcarbamoyl transferase component Bud32
MTPMLVQRINRVVKEALDLPAKERPAFLDAACAGDAKLRAEVDALLVHAPLAPDLDLSPGRVHEGAASKEPSGSEDLTLSSNQGRAGGIAEKPSVPVQAFAGQRYEPTDFHAAGGLGEVFRAHDKEINREVAVKRLKKEKSHRLNRETFLREAEITARLEHPGIVPMYGKGIDADSLPYYAMRFIQGQSMADAIKEFREKFPHHSGGGDYNTTFRELLTRFTAVCHAVAYAHSRGVIHRDIKPQNIMLGKYGETFVVDWGMAKVAGRPPCADDRALAEGEATPDATPISDMGLSLTGQGKGTPAYVSPEQWSGQWDNVGPASDVFSLGATLYALLTGRVPYQGQEAMSLALVAKFPSPREVEPAAPKALEAVCLKAMNRNPEARYATAQELADDVQRWLADEPVKAWPEPWTVRFRRWVGAHRTLVAVTAAALLVGVVSLLATTALLTTANEQLAEKSDKLTMANDDLQDKTKKTQEANQKLEEQLYDNRIAVAERELTLKQDVGLATELLKLCPEPMRGWEWDYLMRLRDGGRDRLIGHTGGLWTAVFSPDGKHIATASIDGTAKVWDVKSGQEVFAYLGHVIPLAPRIPVTCLVPLHT